MKLNKEYPEYKHYRNMLRNCLYGREQTYYNENNIIVCDRWINSFENFLEDMGEKPTPQHKLWRIDTTKNYTPENCVWAITPMRKN